MPKPPPPAQPDSGITPLRSGPAGTYTESRWQSAPFWMEKCIFLSEEMETKKGHLTRELLTANKEPLGWCILNRPQVVHFNRPVRDHAWNDLLSEIGINIPDGETQFNHQNYSLQLKQTIGEIECEGSVSEPIYEALNSVRDKYGGEILCEGEIIEEPIESQTSSGIKVLTAIIMILFLPVTIIVLLLRGVWAAYKIRQTINEDSNNGVHHTVTSRKN
jgi:hypothetical protein